MTKREICERIMEIHDRDFTTDFLYEAVTKDGWTPPDDWKYPEHREICRSFYANMKNNVKNKDG